MASRRLGNDRVAVGLILFLTPLAYLCRFVQDDAFISFRYAANLAAGHGLVFNPGEQIEGYTNFLWTLGMALPAAAGIDPVGVVYGLGLLLFPACLAAAYRLATALSGSIAIGRFVVLLLGTNYSFAAWATGGLETALHTLLITVCVAAIATALRDGWSIARAATASVAAALALLTRLDSAVLLAVPGLVAAWSAIRRTTRSARVLAVLVLPPLLLVGSWLVWKAGYYGSILPNSYWVKLEGPVLLRNGVTYMATFSLSYLLFPLPLVAVVYVRRLRNRLGDEGLALVAGPLLLWAGYLVRSGGDFMEYRLMMPVLPLLMVLAVWAVLDLLRRPAARATVIVVLVAASAAHALTFDRSPLRRPWIESVKGMQLWLERPDYGWIGLGRFLGRHFDRPELAGNPVWIAVTPAGAIPYYSRLRTIDMLGLSDRWIARQGADLSPRPGHHKIATVEYLTERSVHLVLGHPQSLVERPPAGTTLRPEQFTFLELIPGPHALPATARAVLLPYGTRAGVLALYLTPHPAIDAAIERERWPTYGVGR